jgi:hypothetical protein
LTQPGSEDARQEPDAARVAPAPGSLSVTASNGVAAYRIDQVHLHAPGSLPGDGDEANADGAPERATKVVIHVADALTGALRVGVHARSAMFERIMGELESVHGDYLQMFDAVLSRTPEPWERSLPAYADGIRAAADELRRLRLVYEPVRVRLRLLAGALEGATLLTVEKAFVASVLDYFPTGELRVDEEGRDLRTSGTNVLDHFYRSLDGTLGLGLSALIRDTLKFHRRQWSEVCHAYAALEVFREVGG